MLALLRLKLIPFRCQDIVELGAMVEANQSVLDADMGDLDLELHRALLTRIDSQITWHVAPVQMLAHSRTNLAAKVRIFLQTLGMFCSSRPQLVELCNSVASIHTDFGVEKGICRVENISLEVFLPYLHAPTVPLQIFEEDNPHEFVDAGFHVVAEDCFCTDGPDASMDGNGCNGNGQDESSPCVSFGSALEGPDMMHIIHNVTANLEDVVDCYSGMLSSLKAICSLLAGRESKQQVIATCFSDGAALVFQDMVKSFQTVPHEKRWNTIAASIEELHDLEPALRSHWSLQRFLGSTTVPTARPGDTGQEEDVGVNLHKVDSGICSDYFWGSLKVMLQVAMVQRQAVQFANACPCHEAWQHSENPALKSLFEMCPMRGRRCAELASGHFFSLLQSLFDACATRLEIQLPRGLRDSEMAQLMRDFETARQHVVSSYVLKLSFWMQPPHAIAGIAHFDPTVRADCVRKCLKSRSTHPKIKYLKDNLDAVQEFLAGGGLWNEGVNVLKPLRLLACEMSLMFTSAWRVEAQHARTKRASQMAPHHSASYTSLSHRLPDIKQHLTAHPQSTADLVSLMDVVSNGRAAARHLGFSEDLVLRSGWVSGKTFKQKDMGFRVIYHDDPYCKYSLDLPRAVPQRSVQQCEPSPAPAPAVDRDLVDGSVALRRVLALQDVRRSVQRKMFFTMKFPLDSLYQLSMLLAPKPEGVQARDHFALDWDSTDGAGLEPLQQQASALPDFGQTQPLRQLLQGGGSALADEFVVGSVVHEQPNRFPRTHVEGEASLLGMWFIQLHNIMHVDLPLRCLQVSVRAASVRTTHSACESSPLTLHVNHLSLEDLLQIYVWEVDEEQLFHRLDNQFMSSVPPELADDVPDVLDQVFKSASDGLVVTAAVSERTRDVLRYLESQGIVRGPPWRVTDMGHERIVQCVNLRNSRKLLAKCSGPLHEATLFQLILRLDDLGWKHEIITTAQHKSLRKRKHVHEYESEEKVWYTQETAETVSRL